MEGGGAWLQWNIENWITVLLMAALGYLLFALVTTAWRNYNSAQGR